MKNYPINYNRSNNVFDYIDSAFDDLFRPLFYDEKLDAMKTDIRETKDSYILDVEMPGFEKSEISLDVENGYLTIRAEKSEKRSAAFPASAATTSATPKRTPSRRSTTRAC